MERVPAGRRKAPIPGTGPRQPHAIAGALLDRIRAAVLFFFYDPGILFDAVLPRPGVIDRLRSGCGGAACALWNTRRCGDLDAGLRCRCRYLVDRALDTSA